MPDFDSNFGLFIPTTNVWDVGEIQDIDVNSQEFKELLVRLYQNMNLLSVAVNLKESGYYNTLEFVNSQLFFPNPSLISSTLGGIPGQEPTTRQVYRKVINFGALPNATTKAVAHGISINTGYSFTRIYGCASDTTGLNYIPLPYASPTLVNNIELKVDGTNVTVITGSNRSNFNITYIILEYLKF